ncbi:hypothetical protein AAVH_22578 [Aphelenchoides avenae]|nr:hypothetical protein AAVH_22578 [Aphelenchus avenae]
MYDDSRIDQEDPETHEMIHYLRIRTAINKIAEHAVEPALGHAQQLFLTAIAVNRFTAFAFPLKHASMWRTRTVVVVTGREVSTIEHH